jgi:CheY-like chemotaxis protein
MSRILLADDSPHAQRMGERILREEGFEVVTVTDGETALLRLPDVDPDVVMADVFLPHRSGYEICRYIKSHPRYRHARVVLLAGLLEPVDEAEAQRVQSDGVLKKPFEASVMMAAIRPLAEAAQAAREAAGDAPGETGEAAGETAEAAPDMAQAAPAPGETAPATPEAPGGETAEAAPGTSAETAEAAPDAPRGTGEAAGETAQAAPAEVAGEVALAAPEASGETAAPPPMRPEVQAVAPLPPVIDAELVRAAVTVALDRAMPAMIDEITERVLVALGQ